MSIEALVEVSRFYGSNADYVLAGGGNTSWKDVKTLYVKGSGMSLADVSPDSFVSMDRKALAQIWEKKYPESSEERESAVLADMMAARKSGVEKRPSVEALLHDIIPFNFVVHLHPALVNGLTCSRQGEKAMTEIFGEDAIWIPITNPGYVLASKVKNSMKIYVEKYNKQCQIIFMQNHGIFVGANDTDIIKELYDEIMSKILAMIIRKPDFQNEKRETPSDSGTQDSKTPSNSPPELSNGKGEGRIEEILQTLSSLSGASAFLSSSEISAFIKERSTFYPLSSAFTPDHIVYAGSEPLFIEIDIHNKSIEINSAINEAWNSFVQKTGRKPKIIAVQGLGVFSAAATEKAAMLAVDLFKDAVKVAVYTESFGGALFMTQEQIDFINNWEVEAFRTKVAAK